MKLNAICTAGAHRSGISMLTRLLHRCGPNLGRESYLMPAATDNPEGFWEHLEQTQALLSAAAAQKQLFAERATIPRTTHVPRPDYPATPTMP